MTSILHGRKKAEEPPLRVICSNGTMEEKNVLAFRIGNTRALTIDREQSQHLKNGG